MMDATFFEKHMSKIYPQSYLDSRHNSRWLWCRACQEPFLIENKSSEKCPLANKIILETNIFVKKVVRGAGKCLGKHR